MADEFDFGEAVLDIKTDRSKLTAGLKQAQIQTSNASAQMSKSLDKATGSTQATTASLLLLDKAAVASGSSSLAYTRVLVELTLAMGGLKEVSKAATASFVGMQAAMVSASTVGVASVLAITIPFAAMAAAVVIVIALVAALFNVRRIADWTTGLKGANKRLEEMKQKLQDVRDRQKQVNDAIRIQIRQAKGEKFAGIRNLEQLNLAKELDKIQQVNKWREKVKSVREATVAAAKAENEATTKRIDALRTEMGLLTGEIKPVDLLKTMKEKILFLANESLKVEKEQTKEAKSRADAAKDAYLSRRKELGLPARGKTSVLSELRARATTELGEQLKRAQQIRAIQFLRPELQGAARQMLGVSTGGGVGGVGGSVAALGGVRQALSAGRVSFGGVKTEVNLLEELVKKGVDVEKLLEQLVAQEKGLGAFSEN